MRELIEIQARLIAPKSQYNSFGKYNYRNLEDIMTGVKPLLDELGCVLILSDDIRVIGERYYVEAIATLTNSNGEKVTNHAFAREPIDKKGMDESQITGAASSYARKYALSGLFCIDDNKDADSVLNLTEAEIDAFNDMVESDDGLGLYLMSKTDQDKYLQLGNQAAPKGQKTAYKEKLRELVGNAYKTAENVAHELTELADNDDAMEIRSLTDDLERNEKTVVWSILSIETKDKITELLKGE